MSAAIVLIAKSPNWELGLQDPTAAAWLLVACYLMVAVGCWRSGGRLPGAQRTAVVTWFLLAGLLLFLGINKQLDFHALGFEWASNLAHSQGWYEQRWIAAKWGFALMAVFSVFGGVWLIYSLRSRSGPLRLAIVAAMFLVLILIAQSISRTTLGGFLQGGLFGAELNAWWRVDVSELFELGALATIGLAVRSGWVRHGD